MAVMPISTWQDLFDHVEHDISATRDVEQPGKQGLVCMTCDEVLSSDKFHTPTQVDALVTYYRAVEASKYWNDVKKVFPHPDDEPVMEKADSDG